MIEILSVENMRQSDAHTIAAGCSGRELMMRAGRAIFENADWKPPVAIVCGTGNNAGDGYVLAGLLNDAKIPCTLVLLEEKFSADGKYYFDICREKNIDTRLWRSSDKQGENRGNKENSGDNADKNRYEIRKWINGDELAQYSTIVDCIFGTGFKGDVRGKAAEVIKVINSSGAYVISVDINSGLNGDSGMAELCVHSDLTVSIGSFKPGHFLNMAKDVMKKKINCDIGITPVEKPYRLLQEDDLRSYFTPRPNYSHKGTYGYTALIGGSKRYSGAIRLAAMANAAVKGQIPARDTDGDKTDISAMANAAVKGQIPARDTDGDKTDIAAMANTAAGVQKPVTDTDDNKTDIAAMANAAMRAGAGVVKVAVPNSLYQVVAANILESTIFPLSDDDGEIRFVESEIAELISNVRTVAFGMGIGVTEETSKILNYLLENYNGRLIVDADGLTLLSRFDSEKIRNSKPELILTPHIKEFSRLIEGCKLLNHNSKHDIGNILSTPIESSMDYASSHNVVLLLKGPSTIITDGDITFITDTGCAGMATAGSGDVLSGILSAVCSYLPDALFSVAAGAFINGKAGELAQKKLNSVSMVASDTVSCIAEAITQIS